MNSKITCEDCSIVATLANRIAMIRAIDKPHNAYEITTIGIYQMSDSNSEQWRYQYNVLSPLAIKALYDCLHQIVNTDSFKDKLDASMCECEKQEKAGENEPQ